MHGFKAHQVIARAGYATDLDTFAGNSGSGVFTDDGALVGLLISGATDFVKTVGNWGGTAAASCHQYSRCSVASSALRCHLYDTSVAPPAACANNRSDPATEACYAACSGSGRQRVRANIIGHARTNV